MVDAGIARRINERDQEALPTNRARALWYTINEKQKQQWTY